MQEGVACPQRGSQEGVAFPQRGGSQEGVACPQRGSQRVFSVLDRLLVTHPVWLQLSLSHDSALYILLREPVGTFLVRRCSSNHRKVLCLRVTGERHASSVKECFICEEDSTFALETSALSFPDLCRLVAFYCISRDVLPFPLQLPEAIAKATTHRQLEAISHMGQEFWSSPSPSEVQNGPVQDQVGSARSSRAQTASDPLCALLTRGRQLKECFINPLFLQLEQQQQQQVSSHRGASNKRQRFKRSMRLRLSNDSSVNLSLEGTGSYSPCSSTGGSAPPPPDSRLLQDSINNKPQRRVVHPGAGLLRRTPAVSPGSAEEEVLVALTATQVDGGPQEAQRRRSSRSEEPDIELTVLALQDGCPPAPSLAELDSSSSFSSLDDEDPDPGDDPPEPAEPSPGFLPATHPTQQQQQQPVRPPLVRSRGGRGGLHQRMNAAFVCFFEPEKRLTRLVEELSRDRRSAFGAMVQDFLARQREMLSSLASSSSSSSSSSTVTTSSVEILQALRGFLCQAKSCLLDSGELEPPIDTLVTHSEKDLALERAMFSCVLRPLKAPLGQALVSLHHRDGSGQRLAQGLLRHRGGGGGGGGGGATIDPAAVRRQVERARQKLSLMQRTYSPIDKVLLLLQLCKCVHAAMGSCSSPPHGQEPSWEDFLPWLCCVIVECNRPHILLEVEYMMELLQPSWLCGEGGYYLTSVYASLCWIQSTEEEEEGEPSPGRLNPEAQEALRAWGRRRGREAQNHRDTQHSQRCVRILFQDGERSAVRTLQWRAGESSAALAQLCADTFGVQDAGRYALYWRSGGEMRPLPAHAQPQDLAGHSEGGPSLSYLRLDHDFSKMRRLTRGGAVDLSESVCEE